IVCDKKSDASKENSDDSLVKEQVLEDTSSFVDSSLNVDKETVFLVDKKIEFVKPKNNEKPVKKSFRMNYNYTTNRSHPNAQRNMVLRAILMKTGLKPFNTARTVNIAHPKSTVFSAKLMSCFPKTAQSTVRRPFQTKTTLSNKRFTQVVNTARLQAVNTARPKTVKTARPNSTVVNAVRGKPQQDDTGFVDSGCSRHMTENIAYLSDFKEFDEGYVTFGRGAHGGRISGKGTLKTDSLDFEDVYFVNELKFNLFSISQMCDKKNYVLFTETECLVLPSNFKLPDEKNQILLKIPRKDNIEKGIKREYSVAKTPQQNGMAERRNRTLIEAARIMLADFKLPTTFWAEAISTACYVQNRILVVKPHNKTPYELFRGIKPALSFMRPFRCHVTILNTLDSLGKFNGKSDEGFFIGYSLSSKAFRVYNTRTGRVEENLHIRFIENKPMIEGNGPKWLFDIDSLTQSMNYVPIAAGTITNESAGIQGELNADTSTEKEEISQDCIVMPIWKDASYFDSPSKDVDNGEPKSASDDQKQVEVGPDNENDEKDNPEVNTGRFKLNTIDPSVNTASSYDQDSPKDMFTMGASYTLEVTHVEFFSDEDEPEVDLGNITNSYTIRRMTKPTSEQGFLSAVYEQKTHNTLNTCLYACFLSQIEPTSIAKALSDSSWVEAMQEELLQFKLQQVWILVDLPIGKRAIGTKWVFRNKKDERRIMIRNKARLVARVIEKKKSAFLYGTIEEEVYVTQPPGFKDPDHPDKVYKVVKALYGLHQAPRVWYETLANYLLGNGFKRGKIDQTLFTKKQKGDILLVQMSSMGELTFLLGLQVQQKEDGIFISQDKYGAEILKKFNYTDVKSASTPVDLEKPLVKDEDDDDVDVHIYRSMIRSLMYLIASRPYIMFAVCACAKFQVTPKTSHLLAVKRIFRYLKGKPTLGLWYSRDSPFELVAYTDSDYAGVTQDRKSTTGGSEYVAAASWYRQRSSLKGFEMEVLVLGSNSAKAKHIEYLMLKASPLKSCMRGGHLCQYAVTWMEAHEIKCVGDEAVHKELGDRMERAATTASSLEAEQDSVMANLEFCDTHNMVAYLLQTEEVRFSTLVDFLNTSHIKFALTENPTIYRTLLIQQFWKTASTNTLEDGEVEITATIDGQLKTITEASLRRHLKLEDVDGISSLPNSEIFEQLALMGHASDSEKLTFQKGHFSPQ
ncbi:putative ribonuclease H-like domain-containing protein, partial [Tanacetum coccineum]